MTLPLRGEKVQCSIEEPHSSHLQALPCRNSIVGELYPIICPGVKMSEDNGAKATVAYSLDTCRELFSNYKNQFAPMVKKPNPVWMIQQQDFFSVETNEGWVTGNPGDFLAHDPISGHFWPVAQDYVAIHYELIDGKFYS